MTYVSCTISEKVTDETLERRRKLDEQTSSKLGLWEYRDDGERDKTKQPRISDTFKTTPALSVQPFVQNYRLLCRSWSLANAIHQKLHPENRTNARRPQYLSWQLHFSIAQNALLRVFVWNSKTAPASGGDWVGRPCSEWVDTESPSSLSVDEMSLCDCFREWDHPMYFGYRQHSI